MPGMEIVDPSNRESATLSLNQLMRVLQELDIVLPEDHSELA
jgi:hypothetical protein